MPTRAHRLSSLAAVFAAFTLVACGGGGGGGAGAAGGTIDTTLAAGAGSGGGDGSGAALGSGTGDGSGTGTGDGSGTGTGDGSGTGTGDGSGTGGGSGGGSTGTDPALPGIVISPENPVIVLENGSHAPLQLSASSDESDQDVTGQVSWTAEEPALNELGQPVPATEPVPSSIVSVTGGAVTATGTGTAVIRATLSGFNSATTLVTVIAPPPVPTLSYLWLQKGSVRGGADVSAKVVLTGPATEDVVVSVVAADTYPDFTCATIEGSTDPFSVTISTGSAESPQFTIHTQALPADGARKCRVRIAATAGSGDAAVTRTATLNVRR